MFVADSINILYNDLYKVYMIYWADESLPETKGSTVKPKVSPPYPQSTVPAERFMENRLRDLLLDIEDRIYQGTLGAIKVCGFFSCKYCRSYSLLWFDLDLFF